MSRSIPIRSIPIRRTWRALRLALGTLAALSVVVTAHAIPTNPDPCHTAACTPWSNVAIAALNPATDAHQHRNANSLFGMAGAYKTYSVWDDRTYRYDPVADAPLVKPPQDYGHGFINVPPRYIFDNTPGTDVPLWAQPLIGQVIDQWAAAVNELGTNSNNIATETKIQFQQVPPMMGGEITIKFSATYPIGNGANSGTFPNDSDIYDDGGVAMQPMPGGGAPQGGRSGILAFWTPATRTLTFNRNINWYQDTGNPANDNNPNFMPNLFDFYTTALHEWGHVLGLDHPMMPGAGTTMQPTQGRRNMANSGIIRTLDPGTVEGAKDLYTIIRCPQPVMPPAQPPPPQAGS
jgi:hypothetical protein